MFDARGGTIEVRRRDERLRDPDVTNWSDLLEAENLHIIENGSVNQSNALNTTLAYLQPYYHLDPQGVLAKSRVGDEKFEAERIPPKDVAQFWESLQTRFVKRRHSRYGQLEEKTNIPDGCISVFLQGEFPQQQRTAYCDPETMLRTVAKNAKGRPVVVKAHPSSNVKQEAELIFNLMSEGVELHPTNANIHDILEKSAVSVSYNSAVAIEGFMHHTPAILFGKSDFHHVCETVRETEHFPEVMKRALESDHDYPAYLYWYFQNYCYDINDSGLDEKLLARFAQLGFTKERLGLVSFEKHSWLKKALLSKQAGQELSSFLDKQPEITRYALLDAIKVTEKSWVYKAKVNGEKVIVKRFLDGDIAHTVRSLKGELDYLETVFDDDRFQANRCLYAWPESGTVILSFAPGKRLGDKIAGSSGKARMRLMKQSGEWLHRYCESRQRNSTFGPGFWVKQVAAKNTDHITSKEDRMLLERLLASLQEQVENVKGVPVVQAATHGDFVGINTHFHRGTIYGVDIQGECWLAIAKEAARFLVWLQIHDPDHGGGRRYGISLEYIDAFLQSNVLSHNEQMTTLPFFLGEQLYGRFVEGYDRPDIRENARSAIETYL
ncbi:MAG TPA: hypothetical protein DIT67_10655 [Octadecabacter sp.]|nr:hypothetical protein [Octadecabacter sp.]